MEEKEIKAVVDGMTTIGGMSGSEALILGLVLFMVFNVLMIVMNMLANRKDKEKSSQRNSELVHQILTMAEAQKNAISEQLTLVKKEYHTLELKVNEMEFRIRELVKNEGRMQGEIYSNKKELDITRQALQKCLQDLKNCKGDDDND